MAADDELLLNPHFANWSTKAVDTPKNFQEICPGWYLEVPGGQNHPTIELRPLKTRPKSGLKIELQRVPTWVRVWQPVQLTGIDRTVKRDVSLAIGAERNSEVVLDWVALLQDNAVGKRVFARKLFDTFTLPAEIQALRFAFEADELSNEKPYYFVIQMSGTGIACLRSCSIELETEERPLRNIVVPGASLHERQIDAVSREMASVHSGAISRIQDGRAEGWLEGGLPDTIIMLLLDGQIVCEIGKSAIIGDEGSSNGRHRRREFAVEIPERLRKRSSITAALFDTSTHGIVPGSVQKFDLNPAPALLDAHRTAVAARQPDLAQPPAGLAHQERRRSIAVVAWDMGHNPVGRAYLLADMAARQNDVELVGPLFPQYGGQLWPPIAGSEMKIQTFPARDLSSLVQGAKALAASIKCDAVYVGKPRLPSLLLGALIKYYNQCPMIVDVDDHELSFVANQKPATFEELKNAAATDIDVPHSEIWTRFCENLITSGEAVTVSNIALQKRFGGVIVRHGRNERLFNPRLYDRDKVRAEFGYGKNDRVILFLGTPRAHKGIFSIADALEEIDDQRLALCIIGTITDKRVSSRFDKCKMARISLHPDQPWERLPELVSMADAVLILQDPASPISEYQIPAKLTDALAMGVEVFVTRVPPLADVIAAGAVHELDDKDLVAALRRLAERGPNQRARDQGRSYFLSELSYRVNTTRIETVLEEAQGHPVNQGELWNDVFQFLQSRTGIELPRFGQAISAPRVRGTQQSDLVFLWKQNDSDIYGRRSDMMVKYLLRSGRVRRILHLDAPIAAEALGRQLKHGEEARAHQGNHVFVNTIRRMLHMADTHNVVRRTFIHRSGRNPEVFLGSQLPHKDEYIDFVRRACADAGISENPILWVCPVVFDYPAIREALNPSLTIADVIDDQRRWHSREEYRERVIRTYDLTLKDADLVVANCEAVQQGFSDVRSDIVVVPNGAEIFANDTSWAVPDEMAKLPRPIFGYVGNLRDRVDLDLLRKISIAFPRASVVLIGSAHDRPEILELAKLPNIHLLGVKPYTEAVQYIKAFDVAMMPHLANELSNNMNPLKLYVYFSLGVPIVTTEVANIGDVAPHVGVARSHEEFIVELERALTGTQHSAAANRNQLLETISWEARLNDIWANLHNG